MHGKPSPYRFERDRDGSVRLRIRFTKEEADTIEAAADGEPLLTWLHELIHESAAEEAAALKEHNNG